MHRASGLRPGAAREMPVRSETEMQGLRDALLQACPSETGQRGHEVLGNAFCETRAARLADQIFYLLK